METTPMMAENKNINVSANPYHAENPPPYTGYPQAGPTHQVPNPSCMPQQGYPPQPIYLVQQAQPGSNPNQVVHSPLQYAPTPVQVVAPVVYAQPFGTHPANTTCPSCHHQITTRIETTSSSKTHIIAFLLCCLLCWPCCLIPYCSDDCMNQNHYCPNCNAYLGCREFN